MDYPEAVGVWITPKGNRATFTYRNGTSDWNTIQSCATEDEYGLRGLSLSGWALDVGAHIGGVTVGLALDNPELHVIAVEAVPGNVDLLRRNVAANGLAGRVTIIHGAAGAPGDMTIQVGWGYRGSELAEHHAFIGNAELNAGADHESTICDAWPLDDLLPYNEGFGEFVLAKIDCEGCEARFLRSALVGRVLEWRGEWHPPHVDEAGIHRLLDETHEVTTGGPGPGWFRAVRR